MHCGWALSAPSSSQGAGDKVKDGEGTQPKGYSIPYDVGSTIKAQGEEMEEGDICGHGVCVLKQWDPSSQAVTDHLSAVGKD